MRFFKNKGLRFVVIGGIGAAYPFLLYFFSKEIPAGYLMGGIIALFVLRAGIPFLSKERTFTSTQKNALFLALFIATLMGILSLWKSEIAPLLYPVFMSLGVALVFGNTLLYPPSMIERFARLSEPNLDAAGVLYTRKVTLIWVVFCLLNAALSLTTVLLGDLELWTLYNGCISYVLMGVLMVGEYVVRPYVKGV